MTRFWQAACRRAPVCHDPTEDDCQRLVIPCSTDTVAMAAPLRYAGRVCRKFSAGTGLIERRLDRAGTAWSSAFATLEAVEVWVGDVFTLRRRVLGGSSAARAVADAPDGRRRCRRTTGPRAHRHKLKENEPTRLRPIPARRSRAGGPKPRRRRKPKASGIQKATPSRRPVTSGKTGAPITVAPRGEQKCCRRESRSTACLLDLLVG